MKNVVDERMFGELVADASSLGHRLNLYELSDLETDLYGAVHTLREEVRSARDQQGARTPNPLILTIPGFILDEAPAGLWSFLKQIEEDCETQNRRGILLFEYLSLTFLLDKLGFRDMLFPSFNIYPCDVEAVRKLHNQRVKSLSR